MKKLKEITIWTALPTSFLLTYTASTVMLQVMKSIDDIMYNSSEVLGLVVSILVYKLLEKSDLREWCIGRGSWFMLAQIPLYAVISIFSYHYLEWRFFAIVVLWAGAGEFTDSLFGAKVNKHLSGDELTDFRLQERRMTRVGMLLGMLCILAYLKIVGDPLDLGIALSIQVVAVAISSCVGALWFKPNLCF